MTGRPPAQQGLLVLGAPLGHEAYIRERLCLKRAKHDTLLSRIPRLDSLQAAWLLPLCAVPRASFLLRALPPHLTEGLARDHDDAVARCLAELLQLDAKQLPARSFRTARLAWRCGGLGLRSARADRPAAHWASWCETFPGIQARAPGAAERLLSALDGRIPLPCCPVPPLLTARGSAFASLVSPHLCDRQSLTFAAAPPAREGGDDAGNALRGWQRRAAGACDERACETFSRPPTRPCAYPVPSSRHVGGPPALCTLHSARSSHEDYGPFRTRDNGGCYELINLRDRVKLYKISLVDGHLGR